MRSKLKTYVGQHVLCRGWVTEWEELEDGITRVFVKNPTIKKANKDILFQDQDVLSKEDHINLFLHAEHLENYELTRYRAIDFGGSVYHYTRSNGTHDYGIKTEAMSCLHLDIDRFLNTTNRILRACPFSPECLVWSEECAPVIMERLKRRLDEAGDLLATFETTYSECKKRINDCSHACKENAKQIRVVASNRKLRRAYGIKSNFCLDQMDLDVIGPRLASYF